MTTTKQPFAACGKLVWFVTRPATAQGMQKNISISGTKTVVSMFDAETARALAALFQDEMIPAEVTANGVPLRWDIQVPSEFFEQALRLYEQWELSDAELSYLTTGSLKD